MIEVIGVRFREAGKVYYFAPGEETFPRYSHVIVETARGLEYGTVVLGNKEVEDDKVVQPLKPVVRAATEEDEERHRANLLREREAMAVCQEKILARGLEMKLIDAEYTFDNNKILFYFTADGRVDFRELVKDLASVFKTRIELRQIGVRDETKILGGVGICGRPLCCHTYLADFAPVSIKMAKEQNLSLNPTKISGTCGRLMCCLKNEQETYEFLNSRMPAIGEKVTGPEGMHGEVASVNVLRQTVKVLVNVDGDEKELKEYAASELKFRPRRKKGEKNVEAAVEDAPEAAENAQETVEVNEAVEELSATDEVLLTEELIVEENVDVEREAAAGKGKHKFKEKSPRYEKNRRGSKPQQKEEAGAAADEQAETEGSSDRYSEKKGKGPRYDGQSRAEKPEKAGANEGEEHGGKYRKKERFEKRDGQQEGFSGKYNKRNNRYGKPEEAQDGSRADKPEGAEGYKRAERPEGAEGYKRAERPEGAEGYKRGGKPEGAEGYRRNGKPEGAKENNRPGKFGKNYGNRRGGGAESDGADNREAQGGQARENRENQGGQAREARENQARVDRDNQGGQENGGREGFNKGHRDKPYGGRNDRKNFNNYNNRKKYRDQGGPAGQTEAATGAQTSAPKAAEQRNE